MGRLKTLAPAATCAALVFYGVFCGPAAAIPDAPDEQAHVFATCLGRYSAAREHAWLMGGADVQAEAGFSLFEDLLGAVMDDAQDAGLAGQTLLARRIEAKMAQARLMQLAQFQTDPNRRRNASRLAEHHLSSCQSLVFG